jgi:hypothetical protein
MKTAIQILTCSFLISCASNSVKISNASDLKNLAGVFRIELQLAKINPVCSEQGLQEIEKFLESKSEAEQQEYVLKIGTYLGECIIESYGGQWIEREPGIWGIKLSDGNLVFPIGKVQKFVNDPKVNSFSSFYGVIPMLLKKNDE